MKPSDFQQGQTVILSGKVQRIRGADGDDPAYQGLDVQLADGQLLQTNLANITAPAAVKAVEAAPEVRAVESAPEDKAVKRAPRTK